MLYNCFHRLSSRPTPHHELTEFKICGFLLQNKITHKKQTKIQAPLCFWPSGGTAAWPLAGSGHRPSTSAVTQLENIQRADAGGAPVPGNCWYRCSGLEPGLAGWVWTGLTRDADDELEKRKVRDTRVINWRCQKKLKLISVVPFALSSTSLSESLFSSVTANNKNQCKH